MRPLKLRMTAWGPYKDETEIDFEKVTGGGLYLICGPTGAGKTSIFDALAFALYGNVSGSIREKEGFRSDFAAAEIPTRVELLFSHKGRIYRVMRSPRYERPKKRGGGTVKEPETASLSLPDGRELTGNAEVGAYLIGLLGLTYQQFRQLSMIAQGEFMEILTASSKERTEILRSVFGTEICERFQQLLTAQVKKLYQEIQEQNHRLEEASALAAVNDEEWKGFTYLQRIDYLEKELAELAEQKRDLENQWKQAEKEFQTCILKANEGKQINSLFAEKDRFQEKQKELNAQAAEMEKLRLDLSLRSKAVYVRAYLDAEHALRKSQASYLEAERRSNEQKARYEALEEYYRRASAGLLARGLQEGEPCPVCGSLLHPVPAKLPKEAPTEEQLKREKNRNDILARELLQEHQKSAECYTAFQLAEADAKREALEYWQEEYKERLEVLAKEPEASRRQRERRLRKYDEELEQAARSLEALNKTLTGKKPVDIEELEAERRKKERQRRELLREREHFAAAERSFAGSLRSMREKLEKKEQLEAEYGMIADVEKITKGQNSLRLVFEQYVLAGYFEAILSAANLRLDKMSEGRYELSKVQRVEDARTKESMELEVLDHYTGKYRSAKTLSGGESFKAALSLALGMADVIQAYAGGVEIEALFIDEGFGSLDAQSLDQAMEALQLLVTDSRSIGIISHVEELKERISHQILVKKTNTGSAIGGVL